MNKIFKRTFGVVLAAVMTVSSMLCMNAFAADETEEVLTFVKMDENGNEIGEYPLVKTEPGYRQAEIARNSISTFATLPIWDLSSNDYTLTKSGYALYKLPYRFTGTSGKSVYVIANMTVPDASWAEIAINNVTSGTSYIGSIPMDQSGDLFSISGKLHGILSNNYYTYTMQAESNCTYSDIELYQK